MSIIHDIESLNKLKVYSQIELNPVSFCNFLTMNLEGTDHVFTCYFNVLLVIFIISSELSSL